MGAWRGRAHGPLVEALALQARRPRASAAPAALPGAGEAAAAKQGAVSRMIQIYANRGHRVADIDPLGLDGPPDAPGARPRVPGLGEGDLDTEFPDRQPQRCDRRECGCATSSSSSAHLLRQDRRRVRARVRRDRAPVAAGPVPGRPGGHWSPEARRNILAGLTAAEVSSATSRPSTRRRSDSRLEGGDSLIPLLDDLIQGGRHGVEDIVIGMAHRGRLNVLVNVLGKVPRCCSRSSRASADPKNEGLGRRQVPQRGTPDVRTPAGNVHVALAFNPSHLEVVNPVVEGSVRAPGTARRRKRRQR